MPPTIEERDTNWLEAESLLLDGMQDLPVWTAEDWQELFPGLPQSYESQEGELQSPLHFPEHMHSQETDVPNALLKEIDCLCSTPTLQNVSSGASGQHDASVRSQADMGTPLKPSFSNLGTGTDYPSSPLEQEPNAPDTRHDSDCSWNSEDEFDNTFADIQREMEALTPFGKQHNLLTRPLATRERRIVHALARVRNLGHMTLSPARLRQKRMLVSCHDIVTKPQIQTARRSWKRRKAYFHIDPCHIRIDGWCHDIANLQEHLGTFGIRPLRILQVVVAPPEEDHLLVDFTTPELAADAIETVNNKTNSDAPNDRKLLATYQVLPRVMASAAATEVRRAAQEYQNAQDTPQQEGHAQVIDTMARMVVDRLSSDYDTRRVPTLAWAAHPTPLQFEAITTARKGWVTPQQAFGGYSSEGSNVSLISGDSEYGSEASGRGKRKRHPKTHGGYVCKFEDCGKAFDRMGDKTKHEEAHASQESWQHECEQCRKRFRYPKDLRRHIDHVHPGMVGTEAWSALLTS